MGDVSFSYDSFVGVFSHIRFFFFDQEKSFFIPCSHAAVTAAFPPLGPLGVWPGARVLRCSGAQGWDPLSLGVAVLCAEWDKIFPISAA